MSKSMKGPDRAVQLHWRVASVRRPHVETCPVKTFTKLPLVAVIVGRDCPPLFHPQHSITPPEFKPHVCQSAALTAVKLPFVAALVAGACPKPLAPQHWMTPSSRSAQVCSPPALTATNELPLGGVTTAGAAPSA